jgi:hypothetical protein
VNKYGGVVECYADGCCKHDSPTNDGKCYIEHVVAVDLKAYLEVFGNEYPHIDILDVDLIMDDGTIEPFVEEHRNPTCPAGMSSQDELTANC